MKELTSIEDYQNFISQSPRTPRFVFKHSTRCPVSSHAFSEYQKFNAAQPVHFHVWLKVIECRDLSNHIAAATGVRHESPQVLLIKEGKVLWSASHEGVNEEALKAAFKSALL